jgi:DNA-directed RNA polymerase subunit RPC12/RpoP
VPLSYSLPENNTLTKSQVENGSIAPNVTQNKKATLSCKRQKWYPSFAPQLSTRPYITQTFACKKCKKAFRKDAEEFEESDEYCPHCDNRFVLEAVTPKPMLKVEGEDARIDSRMLKDDRIRGEEQRTIFDVKEAPNKLG